MTAKETHIFDAGVVEKEATETENGSIKYTCSCGYSKTEVILATGHQTHTFAEDWSYNGNDHWHTCTFEGCEVTTAKEEHKFDEGVVVKEATEKSNGSIEYTCSCGYVKTEVILALNHTTHTYRETWRYNTNSHWHVCSHSGCTATTTPETHKFDEGVVTREATETTNGSINYTCTECGYTKTETIVATGHITHTYATGWTKSDDSHWHVCTFNGCKETTTPEAHDFGEGVVVEEATETESGSIMYTCECGKVKIESIPALGHTTHTYAEDWKYDDEKHWHICTFEGCKETTTPEEHDFGEGVVKEEATKTETGIRVYTCACGATKEETIPALGNPEHTEHIYAAAWTYDKTQHWHKCETEGCDETTIPAVHEYTLISSVAATETEAGSKSYKCKCGATKTEVVQALGHQTHTYAEEWKYDETAHWHECTFAECDECTQEQAHVFGTAEIVVEATEDEEGTKKYTCTTCGYSYTETYDVEVDSDEDVAGPLEEGEEFEDETTGITYAVKSSSEAEYVGIEKEGVTDVTIPDQVTFGGVTYKVTAIAEEAFKNNKTLKTIVISSSITEIGNKAFYGCTKLTTVKMGRNVIKIGDSAFQNCTSLKSFTIPSKVTTVGNKAFYGCKKLTTVNMGKNVTTIGISAFQNCIALKKIEIPSKVKKIGAKAFYDCKKLTRITIKTTKLNTKNVGKDAFKKAGSSNYKKLVVKVPKKKLKSYKVMLKKRGLSSKSKVSK